MTRQRWFRSNLIPRTSVSITLQMIGLLAALIFTVSTLFEFLSLNNFYPLQHDLLLLLEISLAVWALLESSLVSTSGLRRPLWSLRWVLLAQLGDILLRAGINAVAPHELHNLNAFDLSSHASSSLLSTAFLLINLLVFMAISRCLIVLYGYAERQKAQLLTQKIQMLDRAKQDLALSEARYRKIFNLQLIGTAILNTELRWTAVNQQCCDILGCRRDELLDAAWNQMIHPDDQAICRAQMLQLDQADRVSFEQEVRFIRRDGSTRFAAIAATRGPAEDDAGSHLFLNIIDITERKRVQADLAAAQLREKTLISDQRDQLEKKLRTSLTAAALVHEIQQPLSSILLNCRLADGKLRSDRSAAIPDELRQPLRSLIHEGERVSQMMERVRMLLRNVQSDHSLIDFSLNIDSALVFLKNELRESQVRWRCDGLEQPCLINADGAQLQIAVVNLIRNGIQAMQAQAPSSRELLLELIDHGERVQLRVSDSGPGFAEDIIASKPLELLRSSKPDGMGIGLFVVQTAVGNHRGQVHLGRSVGLGGAQVVLDLPKQAGRPTPEPFTERRVRDRRRPFW